MKGNDDEDNPSDVCGCDFTFLCVSCSKPQVIIGEQMPDYINTEGKCFECFLEIPLNEL